MQEAENLVKAGVKELLVVSQDTSAYGVDVKYRTGFWGGRPLKTRMTELVRALGELGVWVRLHYVYPYPARRRSDSADGRGQDPALPRRAVPAREPAHPEADEAPGERREQSRAHPRVARRSARRSRSAAPSSSAFPARPKRSSRSCSQFLEEAQLDRVGCFAYSPVEGAAANALPDAVPEEVKEDRRAASWRCRRTSAPSA